MNRLIRVKAHPDAKENRVEVRGADHFEVWVKAPAERGLANAALIALLQRHPAIAPGRLRLVKGAHAPSKIFSVLLSG